MTMTTPAGALSSGHPSLPGRLAALLRERFSDLELLGPAAPVMQRDYVGCVWAQHA